MNYSVFIANLNSSDLDKINALQKYGIKSSWIRSTFYYKWVGIMEYMLNFHCMGRCVKNVNVEKHWENLNFFPSFLSDPEADNQVVILLGILKINCVKMGWILAHLYYLKQSFLSQNLSEESENIFILLFSYLV